MGPVTVVFDTNVVISALGFGGPPLRALRRAFEPDYQLVMSRQMAAELARVMEYERLPFTESDRAATLALLRREAEIVSPDQSRSVVEADPDDDMFIECAVAADARVLVSGDRHLLDIDRFEGIDIVSPAEFLEADP